MNWSTILTVIKSPYFWKVMLVIFGMTSVIGSVTYAYNHYQNLRSSLAARTEQVVLLQRDCQSRDEKITSLTADIVELRAAVTDYQKKVADLRKAEGEVRDALYREREVNKRSLEELAAKKPKLVENVINRATNDVLRCFELSTGGERKPDETLPHCPSPSD